ncbi:Flp family type IVb pilin [Roseibium sp. Sym1]|uniref:Flp family type IVb pilin n=1 Tax=Roseibium sp. Sym1 TaxID=3016006 RepID=UPI0022B3E290|nr:Flp family type IVb pilin [Roseibium sp. Sym1]
MFDLKTGPIDFRPARRLVLRFLHDERGATAMEYGMIVAIIGIIIIAGFGAIGETLRDDVFGAVVSTLDAVLATDGGSGG